MTVDELAEELSECQDDSHRRAVLRNRLPSLLAALLGLSNTKEAELSLCGAIFIQFRDGEVVNSHVFWPMHKLRRVIWSHPNATVQRIDFP